MLIRFYKKLSEIHASIKLTFSNIIESTGIFNSVKAFGKRRGRFGKIITVLVKVLLYVLIAIIFIFLLITILLSIICPYVYKWIAYGITALRVITTFIEEKRDDEG